MRRSLKIILLITIILIASGFRLWQLDNYPAGLNADEASLGYNADSLLKTGKDEYGTSWPLTFKSFGDYKPGLYVYVVMPFVATLGLNEWAVRIPSALFGIGTVVLIYFLALEIFENEWIGIISSLLLAISPWHLQFSRGGWESNVATFFIGLGVWFFIKGLKNWTYLFWSLLSFLVSMYLYQSPRLIVPVFCLVLLVLYRQELLAIFNKSVLKSKKLIVLFLVLLVCSLPLLFQLVGPGVSARFTGLSFYSDPGPASRVNQLRGEHANPNGLVAQLLHNKVTAYGPNLLGHYLDQFDPQFLFIKGDPVIRSKVPETGQFYLIESLFLVAGLFGLARSKFKHTKLLVTWILVSPLAAALTFQTPSALRSLTMVVPITMLMAYGLGLVISWFNGNWKILGIGIIAVILSFEFVHYLDEYYVHYPKSTPIAWEFGFRQMIPKLLQYQDKYQHVVITDRFDQPYILVLFFEKYDPGQYQPQAHLTERDKFNFGTVRSFDKYEFRSINPNEVLNTSDSLFIGTDKEIPPGADIIDKVDFPNGQPAFVFASGGGS